MTLIIHVKMEVKFNGKRAIVTGAEKGMNKLWDKGVFCVWKSSHLLFRLKIIVYKKKYSFIDFLNECNLNCGS